MYRTISTPRSVLLGACLAAVAGAVLLITLLAQPRLRLADVGQPVTVGPLTLSVEDAGWIGHDMSSMGPMPMEGMPAPGTARMRVRLLVGNRTGTAVPLDARDFTVVAGSGESWTPLRATLPVASELPAGGSVIGDLFFEVPAREADFALSLTRRGERAQVALPVAGSDAHARRHAERISP